jgi:hypothetical protein
MAWTAWRLRGTVLAWPRPKWMIALEMLDELAGWAWHRRS